MSLTQKSDKIAVSVWTLVCLRFSQPCQAHLQGFRGEAVYVYRKPRVTRQMGLSWLPGGERICFENDSIFKQIAVYTTNTTFS